MECPECGVIVKKKSEKLELSYLKRKCLFAVVVCIFLNNLNFPGFGPVFVVKFNFILREKLIWEYTKN